LAIENKAVQDGLGLRTDRELRRRRGLDEDEEKELQDGARRAQRATSNNYTRKSEKIE
jgi:hypothetical protein